MKRKTINLTVPRGFSLEEKAHTYPTEKAVRLLTTQKKYSKAEIHDKGYLTLYHTVLRCPYCGGEFPFERFLPQNNKAMDQPVHHWIQEQSTLFEENCRTLDLTPPYEIPSRIYCPQCKRKSTPALTEDEVTISRTHHTICVSCKILGLSDIWNIPWIQSLNLCSSFPCYETIVFNLGNGHTFIKLENETGTALLVRDITEHPSFFSSGQLYNLITDSQSVRKELKKCFREILPTPYPFPYRSQPLLELISITRFIGYNNYFYSTIPYLNGGEDIHPDFKRAAKKMHHAKNLSKRYEEFHLPRQRSTKKIIFSSPGLMFYHKEINILSALIDNPDLFNRLLSCMHIFYILSTLRIYPALFHFLEEALSHKEKKVILHQMLYSFDRLIDYARLYETMSEKAQSREYKKKNWLSNAYFRSFEQSPSLLPALTRFSHPPAIRDCTLDGYTFSWLITSTEYRSVGLSSSGIYEPAIAVKKNHILIALIILNHFDYTKVEQVVYSDHCPSTDCVASLFTIRAWCRRFSLSWESEMPDDLIPF